ADRTTVWAYAIDRPGGLIRSVDGGETWSWFAAPIAPGAHATAITVDALAPDVVYVATSTVDVFRSADGGGTWTSLVVGGEVR
ncbi:MAG: hypothetical protein LC667_15250, partial [Thioalkalivibrio sp.]|nr:hypothetical protein [Thioalkalivibrio sp.]